MLASTAFLHTRASSPVTRNARGGEQSGIFQASAKAPEAASKGDGKGLETLVTAFFGGVVGLGVAVAKTIESMVNKKAEKPVWHPSQEVGNIYPIGYFDPLKLAKDEKKFRQFRIAEIKHGRVAMMAAAGAVVQHYVKLPPFKELPSGVQVLQSTEGQIAFGSLVAACGLVELYVWRQADDKEPGNFGDPANWTQTGLGGGAYNEENREREIVNGRFAMPPSFDWLPEAITCDIGNL
ncbi:unnamed protein product [Effrenium voratum]|uniref:Chlorophyll a-b binding protein, chloroplastic n=1 Tax=Effrenium voratum TaxID=2562239 RepID=A0AA36N988_9DINO|nr:unnamed protein product [Effrenium voratum]